jgi:hypothetical protein
MEQQVKEFCRAMQMPIGEETWILDGRPPVISSKFTDLQHVGNLDFNNQYISFDTFVEYG